MATAQYHSYKIEVSGAMNHVYVYHHEVPVFLGWKALETSEGDLAAEQSKAQGVLAFLGATKTQAVLHHAEATVVTRGLHSHYTESSLIQKLEDHGIGRPSTYALFVETIQERGYVVKRDIEGRKVQCVDFVLRAGDGGMDERTVEKTVGGEKAKLVIQPVGILCIEFLLKHFAELFEYTYTKYLEEELDGISTGADSILPWYSICEKARTDIARMIKATNQTKKEVYPLDQLHELVFLAHGPCIRRHGCENEQGIMDEDAIEFLPIKKSVEIDLEKLKRNEYCIDDLLVYKQSYLGKHQDGGVFLRTGPYGQFIEWNTTKKPLKIPEEKMATVDLVYAVGVLTGVDTVASDPKILRPLNDIMSVRKGQYGNYVFYKTAEMTKPRFVNIRKFTENPLTCEVDVLVQWVNEQVAKPVRGGGGGGKGTGGGGGRKWFPRKKK
jgi:DNA topoisomerase-1